MDEHEDRDPTPGATPVEPPGVSSDAAAGPFDAPPPPADHAAAPPPAPPVAPSAPGGVYPAVPSAPGAAATGAIPPAPKRRRGVVGVAAAVVVGIGAIVAKFGLPILLGAAASGILGGVFGGPFEKLPADQRQALEARFNAAVGDRIDGMADAQATETVDGLIQSGLRRLPDEPLVERLHLTTKLIAAIDEATCAKIAHGFAGGGADGATVLKALESVDLPSVGRWYDISIQALEAEAGSASVRSVDVDEANRILGDVLGGLSGEEAAQIQALYGSGTAGDSDACSAVRAFYREIEKLSAADIAVVALYDVSP